MERSENREGNWKWVAEGDGERPFARTIIFPFASPLPTRRLAFGLEDSTNRSSPSACDARFRSTHHLGPPAHEELFRLKDAAARSQHTAGGGRGLGRMTNRGFVHPQDR